MTRPKHPTRLFFIIRTESGHFVAANHNPEGPPIALVSSPEEATRFVEAVTASRRAAALEHLGWRDLSVVPVQLPCPALSKPTATST